MEYYFKNKTKIRVLKNNQILFNEVTVASNFWSRTKGLLGKKNLNQGEGLLIIPCDAIHMFFMKFPIDVIFLYSNGKVAKVYNYLKPWSFPVGAQGAWMALEIPAGSGVNIKQGDMLIFEKV